MAIKRGAAADMAHAAAQRSGSSEPPARTCPRQDSTPGDRAVGVATSHEKLEILGATTDPPVTCAGAKVGGGRSGLD